MVYTNNGATMATMSLALAATGRAMATVMVASVCVMNLNTILVCHSIEHFRCLKIAILWYRIMALFL